MGVTVNNEGGIIRSLAGWDPSVDSNNTSSFVLRCLHTCAAAHFGQLVSPLVRQLFFQLCLRLLRRGPRHTRYSNSSQSGPLVVELAICTLFAQLNTTIQQPNRLLNERLRNGAESVRLMWPAPSAWSDALPREAASQPPSMSFICLVATMSFYSYHHINRSRIVSLQVSSSYKHHAASPL
jgi:hypothetical protein